ncbi:hypothetical protein HYPSUDRAFT_132346 [Hypholoma sublateritium FD-334 SS-4]|uniref:protein-histidine N-methyltransferase n=1 Tax=Hypholoma sublateritium (strain FD-334 SS-4) TaxID=945553 RepID=A0A0D2LH20_HYPSF|nr:hypothetical protein HYPSUDRAFT_132346 [Hypholoma sublateritium FD-334 SS-4]
MFKFDFDIDDAEEFDELAGVKASEPIQATAGDEAPVLEPFSELPIHQLLDAFPQLISYSPLSIPLTSPRKATTLVRRDLFDARFQLIAEGAGDAPEEPPNPKDEISEAGRYPESDRKALGFLDAPSDLVPGVYEGGLKTWECSLDLVEYLDGLKDGPEYNSFTGKKILDVGCGTGVPSMYVLRELLECLEPNEKGATKTEIHLQDYNASVLQLMTLPNMLLTWYPYRYTTNDSETAPTIDLNVPGEVIITPQLKSAFLESLASLNITLRFFSGSWDTFSPIETAGKSGYDVLLTSETIYRTESLGPLINLMHSACTGKAPPTLESLVSDLNISKSTPSESRPSLCLVAAKVLYFGVGGGVSDFLQAIEGHKGRVETVLERRAGVGRKIMRVYWP